MRITKRAAMLIVGLVTVTSAGVGYALAQSPPVAVCGTEELWLSGRPGGQSTASGLRIPPAARGDEGVTFCIRGVVVHASEATLVERNGERTFHLGGMVKLTIPR